MATMRDRLRVLIAPGRDPVDLVTTDRRTLSMISGQIYNLSSTGRLQVRFETAEYGRNELQTIALSGTSLTGTFTIGFGGQVSDPITYSSTAATLTANVRAGLATLATKLKIASGCFTANCTAAGANSATILVRFNNPAPVAYQTSLNGGLGLAPQAAVTVSVTGLSGGSPAATVTRTTTGLRPFDSSLYSTAYADGYSTDIVVGPRAVVAFAFGTGAAIASTASHSSIDFNTPNGAEPSSFKNAPYQARALGPCLRVSAISGSLMTAQGSVEFNTTSGLDPRTI